jgi:hypothetical protein
VVLKVGAVGVRHFGRPDAWEAAGASERREAAKAQRESEEAERKWRVHVDPD